VSSSSVAVRFRRASTGSGRHRSRTVSPPAPDRPSMDRAHRVHRAHETGGPWNIPRWQPPQPSPPSERTRSGTPAACTFSAPVEGAVRTAPDSGVLGTGTPGTPRYASPGRPTARERRTGPRPRASRAGPRWRPGPRIPAPAARGGARAAYDDRP
jgi:hypothetical protein